jgi:hypothetical protein
MCYNSINLNASGLVSLDGNPMLGLCIYSGIATDSSSLPCTELDSLKSCFRQDFLQALIARSSRSLDSFCPAGVHPCHSPAITRCALLRSSWCSSQVKPIKTSDRTPSCPGRSMWRGAPSLAELSVDERGIRSTARQNELRHRDCASLIVNSRMCSQVRKQSRALQIEERLRQ